MEKKSADQALPLISNKIPGVDGIRAFACLWVFINHLSFQFNLKSLGLHPKVIEFLGNGYLGVGIFFVLSGFLLSIPYWKAYESKRTLPNIKVYFLQRLGRIIPAYFTCVILLSLIHNLWSSRFGVFTIFSMLTFTNPFFSGTFKPQWNYPLWSISIEMHFYLLLPLFALGIVRLRSMITICIYTITIMVFLFLCQFVFESIAPYLEHSVGNRILFSVGDKWNLTRNAFALFPHFLIGFLASGIFLRIKNRQKSPILGFFPLSFFSKKPDLIIVLGSLFCGGLFLMLPHRSYSWPFFHGFIALLLVLLPFSVFFVKIIDNAFTRYTAKISYGIYIWHMPCTSLLKNIWPNHAQQTSMQVISFFFISFLISYIVATLSYYLIEKPVLNKIQLYCRTIKS